MRMLWRAFCVLLALSSPGWADTALERITQRSQLLGFEAVGRLELPGGGYCSGALIRSDIVLTAAHCLADDDGTPVSARDVVFRAGLRDGTHIAERRGRALALHADYAPEADDLGARVRGDIALLKLDAPVAAAPFAAAAPSDVVSVVSYARGRDAAPSVQKACSVEGRWSGILSITCDLDHGASGAPIFSTDGPRPRIAAIVTSGNRDEGLAFGAEVEGALPGLLALLQSAAGPGAAQVRRIGTSSQSRVMATGGARFVRP